MRSSAIRCLLFADDAILVATSLKEAQKLENHFSITNKSFGFTIRIKKTEDVHQSLPLDVADKRYESKTISFHSFPAK